MKWLLIIQLLLPTYISFIVKHLGIVKEKNFHPRVKWNLKVQLTILSINISHHCVASGSNM